ncbi:MAG: hypothetical protein HOQ44_11245 [Nocardia sp.]|nr:hypothetical protein [Nocardia sp.]
MIYVFPDGRTQEVSPVVAQVLDTAFGRRANTDTRPASSGSSKAVPAEGPSDVRHETDPVSTGDLAIWARGSAVVVAFGVGDNRSYEVIVDGRLRPFSVRMGAGSGEFGDRQRPASTSGAGDEVDGEVSARIQAPRATGTAPATDAVAAEKPEEKGAVVNG